MSLDTRLPVPHFEFPAPAVPKHLYDGPLARNNTPLSTLGEPGSPTSLWDELTTYYMLPFGVIGLAADLLSFYIAFTLSHGRTPLYPKRQIRFRVWSTVATCLWGFGILALTIANMYRCHYNPPLIAVSAGLLGVRLLWLLPADVMHLVFGRVGQLGRGNSPNAPKSQSSSAAAAPAVGAKEIEIELEDQRQSLDALSTVALSTVALRPDEQAAAARTETPTPTPNWKYALIIGAGAPCVGMLLAGLWAIEGWWLTASSRNMLILMVTVGAVLTALRAVPPLVVERRKQTTPTSWLSAVLFVTSVFVTMTGLSTVGFSHFWITDMLETDSTGLLRWEILEWPEVVRYWLYVALTALPLAAF
ncbi:hypothetical protein B0T26DRAFT_344714 [Lasiosphaeria miniovina]|uniref:Uncharacterized protein n=1 Tax=Lasiosphaeria miniovina TaxID=1954250 RepID=A0AA40DRD9_9PEZI|nr:uncharacterized protein B0T26DRAFT_344714 [Lasiosphaeria miniovina]KAK0712760.1 hypothetical protein B0T26DRAFT_344714 [Lasiosphaeria miniovina]